MLDPHDPERPDIPLNAFYTGTVIDNADPDGLGRVRIRIDGFVEEGTAWAFPLGFGGGMKQRGSVFVPPVGAEVGVFFRLGDVDQPYYVGGHLGAGEQLTGTDGHPDARAIETENYLIVIDDRPESRSLTLMDKQSGDRIQLHSATRSITLEATAQVHITSKGFVYIDGTEVFIKGIPAGFGRV